MLALMQHMSQTSPVHPSSCIPCICAKLPTHGPVYGLHYASESGAHCLLYRTLGLPRKPILHTASSCKHVQQLCRFHPSARHVACYRHVTVTSMTVLPAVKYKTVAIRTTPVAQLSWWVVHQQLISRPGMFTHLLQCSKAVFLAERE
jgi:hypothetical protein